MGRHGRETRRPICEHAPMPLVESRHSVTRRRCLRALACAPWAWSATAATDPQRSVWPRKRATPAVELPGADGAVWRLAAAKGRPVLLNFWASWCGPCREEMASLQALADRHRAEGLQVMAVNFRESDATVRKFVEESALGLPVLLDREGTAAKAFDVHVFPSTVLVDRAGRVSSIVVGASDWMRSPAYDWVRAAL
jgi:thiol-disulfide isomerase/thioredoxin